MKMLIQQTTLLPIVTNLIYLSVRKIYFFQMIENLPSSRRTLGTIKVDKVRSYKKTILLGDFSQHGGGGLPKSQNFCKFTKYFFVCQIHSEVLKHVLQMGG